MAAKNNSNIAKKVIPKPKDAGVYIDPRTDFGFKRLIGEKDLMIAFTIPRTRTQYKYELNKNTIRKNGKHHCPTK